MNIREWKLMALVYRFIVQRCNPFSLSSCSGNHLLLLSSIYKLRASLLVDIKLIVLGIKASANAGPLSVNKLSFARPHILAMIHPLLFEFY